MRRSRHLNLYFVGCISEELLAFHWSVSKKEICFVDHVAEISMKEGKSTNSSTMGKREKFLGQERTLLFIVSFLNRDGDK